MNHLSLGRLGLCCLLCCGCLSCAILKTSLQPLQSPIIPKLSMFRPPISPLFIQGRVSIPNCLDTNTTYQPASNLIPWDCNCTASIEYWRGRGGGGGGVAGGHTDWPGRHYGRVSLIRPATVSPRHSCLDAVNVLCFGRMN